MTSNSKSLWERTVEFTVQVGERLLAPIERLPGDLKGPDRHHR